MIEERMAELGVLTREVKDYGVSFKRYVRSGSHIYISGHRPDWPAKYCGYNLLSTPKWAIFGWAIFGEAGRHSRLAIGASSLPHNWPVEVEMLVEVAD